MTKQDVLGEGLFDQLNKFDIGLGKGNQVVRVHDLT